MIVYLQVGLNDSISICFFVLSCSDLVVLLLNAMANSSTSLSENFLKRWNTDGGSVTFVIMAYHGPFYDISQGITTFIAVQKCWCVALPFRFKNTFTKKRTVVILSGITLALFSIHMPILTTQGLADVFDPVRNRTVQQLWMLEISGKLYSAVGLISLVFTNTCQMIVIFCLIVLASSLRASSKFRRATKIASNDQMSSEIKTQKPKFTDKHLKKYLTSDKIKSNKESTDINRKITGAKLSGKNTTAIEDIPSVPVPVKATSRKELMAIKSTTFVSILFVSFNTLKLLNYYVILCIPDYGFFGRLGRTYLAANELRCTLELLHCSCNIFVYLKFNTRYRSTLLACCGRSR
ncbi:unnamed protein product [Lymnaea stagnalis]|uniref:G-protein coupled receptors family 1 profile domain-containing protein n=1 Tax=Lymnaea stagnalis TaxID=6523 RepID=A0AAV2I0K8_LYMST